MIKGNPLAKAASVLTSWQAASNSRHIMWMCRGTYGRGNMCSIPATSLSLYAANTCFSTGQLCMDSSHRLRQTRWGVDRGGEGEIEEMRGRQKRWGEIEEVRGRQRLTLVLAWWRNLLVIECFNGHLGVAAHLVHVTYSNQHKVTLVYSEHKEMLHAAFEKSFHWVISR